jgi:hypothetical protein
MHNCCVALDIANGLTKDTTLSLKDRSEYIEEWGKAHEEVLAHFAREPTSRSFDAFKSYYFTILQEGYAEKSKDIIIQLVNQVEECMDSASYEDECWKLLCAEDLMRLSTADIFSEEQSRSMFSMAEGSNHFIMLGRLCLEYATKKPTMKVSSNPDPTCRNLLSSLKTMQTSIDFIENCSVRTFVQRLIDGGVSKDKKYLAADTTSRLIGLRSQWVAVLDILILGYIVT